MGEQVKGHIEVFDPREGGAYRIVLTYEESDHSTPGKTSGNSDVVSGRFLTLVPSERVVQLVEFESDDPAFAGTMRVTWSLTPVLGGTKVTILCEDVPEGICKEDHDAGLNSTLENLAVFAE
ncbi:MAG: SRPBCC domain-containing protein [Alphaproteobacteria bacterium]